MDRHALSMYRNSEQLDQDGVDKEEEPYYGVKNDTHTVHTYKQHDSLKRARVECERCTKTFNQMSHLERHMREVHANHRLHRCKTCFKSYSRRWIKTQHEKDCIQYI